MMSRDCQVKKSDADSVEYLLLFNGTSYTELVIVDWEYMCVCVRVCVLGWMIK